MSNRPSNRSRRFGKRLLTDRIAPPEWSAITDSVIDAMDEAQFSVFISHMKLQPYARKRKAEA